jgi:hypothetical protein
MAGRTSEVKELIFIPSSLKQRRRYVEPDIQRLSGIMRRSSRRDGQNGVTRHSTSSSRLRGKIRPSPNPRCVRRGDALQQRGHGGASCRVGRRVNRPMSIPSSSEAVARALSIRRASIVSPSRRSFAERLRDCDVAASAPSIRQMMRHGRPSARIHKDQSSPVR